MTNKEAYSWLKQPGIENMLYHYDSHTNDALKKAVEALRKQSKKPYIIKYKETVKVQLTENEELVDVFTYHCPCCDLELGDSDWDGAPDSDWQEYCPQCGQRIDWVHDVEVPFYERTEPKKTKVAEIYAK